MALPTTLGIHERLEIAIDDVSDSRLRTLVKDLHKNFPDAKKWLENELLTTEEEIQRHAESQRDIDEKKKDADTMKPADLKRPRRRHVICDNCKEEFDVLDNSKESCRYHPNYEWFDNMVEDCGIGISHDGEEALEEFPQGYIYRCCGRTGLGEPCKADRHVERHAKRMRTYY
ncbi:hypothetical protein FQN53_005890 [Emmonsiellopsis sp. PD_33]|nr:hypothetical protein FQN53_005890 [Emmonsiellopsis sp. PD_33]